MLLRLTASKHFVTAAKQEEARLEERCKSIYKNLVEVAP